MLAFSCFICSTISFRTSTVIPFLASTADGKTFSNVNSSFSALVGFSSGSFSTNHAVSSLAYVSSVHGIQTYSFPFSPIITKPLLTKFSLSLFDTANPAGIFAVFPSASLYS